MQKTSNKNKTVNLLNVFCTTVCLFLKPFTQRTLQIIWWKCFTQWSKVHCNFRYGKITAICNISYMNINPTMNNRCSQAKKENKFSNVMCKYAISIIQIKFSFYLQTAWNSLLMGEYYHLQQPQKRALTWISLILPSSH